MELLFLALFAVSLIACVVTGASVVFALVFGYILFFFYGLIHGKSVIVMLLASFLLCCLISFLTGTSFGSAATIGVICMTMANSMEIPSFLTGGAILAGIFFGIFSF